LQICKILEYKDSNDTIRKLVNKKYIKKLKDIIDDYTIYPNAQPNTLFINEFGLYSLLLRSNQANKHISVKGKYIYIVKSHLDKHLEIDEIDTYKIGKTKKYKIRISNYNTATPNNTYVLYRVKVDDLSAVKNCIKALLSKQVYRSPKRINCVYSLEHHKIVNNFVRSLEENIITKFT